MLTKTEIVWRHLIDGAHHGQRRWPSVSQLAGDLGLSISTTHQALEEPRSMDAVRVAGSGDVRVLDPGRLLILWAGRRRLLSDVRQTVFVPVDARSVEASLDPNEVTLGGFGAITTHLGNAIADYSTVLVYGEARLPRFVDNGHSTEVVCLEPDPILARYGRTTTLGQSWVDLFRTPGWQASRFVYELMPTLLTEVSDAVLQR